MLSEAASRARTAFRRQNLTAVPKLNSALPGSLFGPGGHLADAELDKEEVGRDGKGTHAAILVAGCERDAVEGLHCEYHEVSDGHQVQNACIPEARKNLQNAVDRLLMKLAHMLTNQMIHLGDIGGASGFPELEPLK